MTSYSVSVYTSQQLYNHCQNNFGDGYRAIDRAKLFLEGAINQQSPHSVNVTSETDLISPPKEDANASMTTTAPCMGGHLGTYSNLGWWWYERLTNCSDLSPSADANLLLTDYDGDYGVAVGNYACTTNGGPHIAELPSTYEHWGCEIWHDRMHQALHEVAHCFLSLDYEHDLGYTWDHFSARAGSPFATPNSTNHCGKSVDGYSCWEMQYSDCTKGEM